MTVLAMWERQARLAPITVDVLRAHADRLARELKVTVRLATRDYAKGAKRVYGPPIRNEIDYCRRMHELGHTQTTTEEKYGVSVSTGLFTVANSSGESAAWGWARRRALVWTDAMQDELRRCLATYRRYARHGVNDRIWRELDRVDGHATIGHLRWILETSAGTVSVDTLRARLARVTR
jgi:hypothetical protein